MRLCDLLYAKEKPIFGLLICSFISLLANAMDSSVYDLTPLPPNTIKHKYLSFILWYIVLEFQYFDEQFIWEVYYQMLINSHIYCYLHWNYFKKRLRQLIDDGTSWSIHPIKKNLPCIGVQRDVEPLTVEKHILLRNWQTLFHRPGVIRALPTGCGRTNAYAEYGRWDDEEFLIMRKFIYLK